MFHDCLLNICRWAIITVLYVRNTEEMTGLGHSTDSFMHYATLAIRWLRISSQQFPGIEYSQNEKSMHCQITPFITFNRLGIPGKYSSLAFLILRFPGSSAGKESACNVGDLGLIPGLGRSPGEGNSYPCQSSDLENSMDYIVHAVARKLFQECIVNLHF